MSLPLYLEALEKEISITKYGESPIELYAPLDYLMSLGGKRMRPCLTLMAANLWLYNWQKIIKPALAVEVFHNFTLMHDDIMDQASLRRGMPTVHEKWDKNTAILSGDVMLVAAYDLFNDVEEKHYKRVLKRFNKTAAEVCEGQQLDMMYANKEVVSKAEYLEMIRLKTSVLLGFALELGGIIADGDEESIAALYQIGVNTGLGFQVHDDILDLYGDPEKFGKKIGGDIIEKKKTWLLIDAIQESKGTAFEKELSQYLKKKSAVSDTDVERIREIFSDLGVKERAQACAEAYFEKAFAAIKRLQISDDKKEKMVAFVNQIKNRES
jgi:geranylgeranyl diphosphate synthase, type II